MPKRDGTGPSGTGSMTGKGEGLCIVPLTTGVEELEYLKKKRETLKKELTSTEIRVRNLLLKQ